MEMESTNSVHWFIDEARKLLKPYLGKRGVVIYSNNSTLCRNPVLFYGLNPGYDPSKEHRIFWTIEKSLDEFGRGFPELRLEQTEDLRPGQRLHADFNLIDDQRWPRRNLRSDYRLGQAPYQNHVRALLREIGRERALITNWLFLQAAR